MGVVRGPWNWWPNMKFQTKESQDWGWGEKNAKQVQIPKKKHTPICGGGAHFHIGRPHHTKLPNSWTFSECFLVLILRWSSYYNMELNLEKCINLTLNRHQSSIRYMDGTLVPRKQSATYLGTLLSDTVDNRKEIMNRIFDSTRICNKLKLFWNKARTSLRWKLKVFHSIIRSKLLYGLECIQLNQAERNKLNAFQIKCYRRILHIPPTSVDRTVTNEDVKRILQDQHGLKVTDFSDMWIHKKIKLLGHIIRSHNQDPMKQVLFEPYTLTPRIEHSRRVGKPRAHWLIETYADAYKAAGMLEQFDMENIQHRNVIHDMAMQRTGIFQWDRLLYIYYLHTSPKVSSPKDSSPKAGAFS